MKSFPVIPEILFILTIFSCQMTNPPPLPPPPGPTWEPIPIRSQAEVLQQAPGGESYQIMHALVRSYNHPDRAYAMEDVAGPWRSDDGGRSWKKPASRGFYLPYGQTIAVDPVNPDKVLAIGYYPWIMALDTFSGIYLSQDGAQSFTRVSDYNDPDGESYSGVPDFSRIGFNWNIHRFNNQNLVYDPSSTQGYTQEAQVWYAAFHGGHLVRSEDGGKTWSSVCSLEAYETIFQVAVHPTDPQILFLCTNLGLKISQDRGSTWQALGDIPAATNSNGAPYFHNTTSITSLAFNPKNPQEFLVTSAAQVKWATDGNPSFVGNGVYRTTDGGSHFTRMELTAETFSGSFSGKAAEFLRGRYVYWHPQDEKTIFIIGDTQVYFTHNQGQLWYRAAPATVYPGLGRDVTSGRKYQGGGILAQNPQDPLDNLYFASAAFWRSDDGGQSVHESSQGFTGMAWGFGRNPVAYDRLNPDKIAHFDCDVGMKITLNGGLWFEDWGANFQADMIHRVTDLGQGINAGDFQPVKESQVIVAASGQYQKNHLVRSTDLGKTWTLVRGGDHKNYYFVGFHPKDPNLVFSHNLVSKDAGLTWEDIPFPAESYYNDGTALRPPVVLELNPNHPDTLYALTDSNRRIWRSQDRGVTWSLFHNFGIRISNGDGTVVFASDPFDPDHVAALDYNSGNLISIKAGQATIWPVMNQISGNLPGNHVASVIFDPTTPGVIYAGTHYPGLSCIFRSRDGGKTWEDITGNLPQVGMISSRLSVNPHTGELQRGGPYGTWRFKKP